MHKLRRAVAIGVVTVALALPTVGVADAKITQRCENPAGNEVRGNCQGQALEQTNVNPQGKAPPGQNK